jgi:hypothetical protein
MGKQMSEKRRLKKQSIDVLK